MTRDESVSLVHNRAANGCRFAIPFAIPGGAGAALAMVPGKAVQQQLVQRSWPGPRRRPLDGEGPHDGCSAI